MHCVWTCNWMSWWHSHRDCLPTSSGLNSSRLFLGSVCNSRSFLGLFSQCLSLAVLSSLLSHRREQELRVSYWLESTGPRSRSPFLVIPANTDPTPDSPKFQPWHSVTSRRSQEILRSSLHWSRAVPQQDAVDPVKTWHHVSEDAARAQLEHDISQIPLQSPLNVSDVLARCLLLHSGYRLECFASHFRHLLESDTLGSVRICDRASVVEGEAGKEFRIALLQDVLEINLVCNPNSGVFEADWGVCGLRPFPDIRELQQYLGREPQPPQFPQTWIGGIFRILARLRSHSLSLALLSQVSRMSSAWVSCRLSRLSTESVCVLVLFFSYWVVSFSRLLVGTLRPGMLVSKRISLLPWTGAGSSPELLILYPVRNFQPPSASIRNSFSNVGTSSPKHDSLRNLPTSLRCMSSQDPESTSSFPSTQNPTLGTCCGTRSSMSSRRLGIPASPRLPRGPVWSRF